MKNNKIYYSVFLLLSMVAHVSWGKPPVPPVPPAPPPPVSSAPTASPVSSVSIPEIFTRPDPVQISFNYPINASDLPSLTLPDPHDFLNNLRMEGSQKHLNSLDGLFQEATEQPTDDSINNLRKGIKELWEELSTVDKILEEWRTTVLNLGDKIASKKGEFWSLTLELLGNTISDDSGVSDISGLSNISGLSGISDNSNISGLSNIKIPDSTAPHLSSPYSFAKFFEQIKQKVNPFLKEFPAILEHFQKASEHSANYGDSLRNLITSHLQHRTKSIVKNIMDTVVALILREISFNPDSKDCLGKLKKIQEYLAHVQFVLDPVYPKKIRGQNNLIVKTMNHLVELAPQMEEAHRADKAKEAIVHTLKEWENQAKHEGVDGIYDDLIDTLVEHLSSLFSAME